MQLANFETLETTLLVPDGEGGLRRVSELEKPLVTPV
jgi:hypothetical protein